MNFGSVLIDGKKRRILEWEELNNLPQGTVLGHYHHGEVIERNKYIVLGKERNILQLICLYDSIVHDATSTWYFKENRTSKVAWSVRRDGNAAGDGDYLACLYKKGPIEWHLRAGCVHFINTSLEALHRRCLLFWCDRHSTDFDTYGRYSHYSDKQMKEHLKTDCDGNHERIVLNKKSRKIIDKLFEQIKKPIERKVTNGKKVVKKSKRVVAKKAPVRAAARKRRTR